MARYYDFAGQKIIIPGAYTDRSFPEDEGAGAVIGRVVIMGEATKGGIPYNAETDIDDVINVIEGQSQALEVFGGGSLYFGAEFYLTPTKDARFNKPSQANCIVVNQMTQALTELKDSNYNSIIDVAYNKYGTDGNSAGIKVGTGTNEGKLLQMVYKGDEVLNQDDVTLDMMSIQYTGTGTTAELTINTTTLSTSCPLDSVNNLSITLADYSDLGSLVNYINNQTAYSCTLTGQSDEFATVFDAVTAQDIKTSAYNCVGIVEAIIRTLNATERVTASLTSGAARTVLANLADFQYLTGGTVSAATTQDWIDALTKLETYDLNCIVAMTGSTTIQDLLTTHCENMNNVKNKKYRQGISGAGSTTATKAQRIAQMKAMNSAYMEYSVSSFERYDYVNRVTTSFDPFYLAPLVAGFRYARK
jgi:hypothetical protein